jgi:hypothetical protein
MRVSVATLMLLAVACSPLIDAVETGAPNPSLLACTLVDAPGSVDGPPEEWSWSQETKQRYAVEGLNAWRTFDSRGFACASCHLPEPLDFALLGTTDDQLRTHAARFSSEQVVEATRRYLRLTRSRYNLRKVCSPNVNPFQPGGAVLADDEAVAAALRERNLKLVTAQVKTLDDARALWSELNQLDIRTLPMAVPLPPWSAPRSLNDWMTSAPPLETAELFSLHDQWLARADEATTAALEAFLVAQGAPAAAFPSPAGLNSNWLQTLSARKHAAALRATFMLRERLFGRTALSGPSHALAVAQINRVDPCADDACSLTGLNALPGELALDHGPEETVESAAATLSERWHVLAMVLDPGLLRAPTVPPAPGTHFAAQWRLPPALQSFQQPMLHVLRLLAQQRALAPRLAGMPQEDNLSFRLPPKGVRSLLLDGDWLVFPAFDEPVPEQTIDWPSAALLRLNLVVSFLLLQKDALEAGSLVAKKPALEKLRLQFERTANDISVANTSRIASGKRALPESGVSASVAQIEGLLENTAALIAAAQDAAP